LVPKTGKAVTQAYPDQKLLTRVLKPVTWFLEDEGRNIWLKNWQFIQTLDAIQKLERARNNFPV